MKIDKLWFKFFKDKYVKSGYMVTTKHNPASSRFWKAILKVFLEVYDNGCVKIREGKVSFWFDKWLSSGPLAETTNTLQQPKMKVNEC